MPADKRADVSEPMLPKARSVQPEKYAEQDYIGNRRDPMTLPTRADGGIDWATCLSNVELCFDKEDADNIIADMKNAAAHTRERCAKIAMKHRGEAAKRRKMRGQSLSSFTDEHQAEIRAEERGEDIAAEMIAAAIRKTED